MTRRSFFGFLAAILPAGWLAGRKSRDEADRGGRNRKPIQGLRGEILSMPASEACSSVRIYRTRYNPYSGEESEFVFEKQINF